MNILSWSMPITVTMTTWRSGKEAWPQDPWWADIVAGTRPRPMCQPLTCCILTLNRTIRSVDRDLGLDIKQVILHSFLATMSQNIFSACGGEFSSPSGIIRSPYHPANYPQHRQCKYRISAQPGNVIQIQFR